MSSLTVFQTKYFSPTFKYRQVFSAIKNSAYSVLFQAEFFQHKITLFLWIVWILCVKKKSSVGYPVFKRPKTVCCDLTNIFKVFGLENTVAGNAANKN
jgi:hypothetical protein